MYIQDARELARALHPFLENRVLVRYAVQGGGRVSYGAEVIVLVKTEGDEYLYRAQISLQIARGSILIESEFTETCLKYELEALEDIAREWLRRSVDDWCHGEQFMGTYEILREGQLHTSVKLPSADPRWHLLAGVVLGEIRTRRQRPAKSSVDAQAIAVMDKRFTAFTSEQISVWADQALSAY